MTDYKEILYEKAARRRSHYAEPARSAQRDHPKHAQGIASGVGRS